MTHLCLPSRWRLSIRLGGAGLSFGAGLTSPPGTEPPKRQEPPARPMDGTMRRRAAEVREACAQGW
jgi:hypothetical protein